MGNRGRMLAIFRTILIFIIAFSFYNCLSPDKSHIDKRVYLERIERQYYHDLLTGLIDTTVQVTILTKYDSLGNEIEEIYKDKNRKIKFTKNKYYKYFPNEELKQITTNVNNNSFFQEIFLYDSNGIKIQEDKTIITNGKGHEKREFRYSKKYKYQNGKLTEELELPDNDVNLYFYDDKGYLKKKLTYWANKLQWIDEYKYDSLGNKISNKWTDAETGYTYTWLYTYDNSNRKIETIVVNEEGNQHSKWTYKYDVSNRIIETIEFGLKNKPAAVSKITFLVKKPFKNLVPKDNRLFIPDI